MASPLKRYHAEECMRWLANCTAEDAWTRVSLRRERERESESERERGGEGESGRRGEETEAGIGRDWDLVESA